MKDAISGIISQETRPGAGWRFVITGPFEEVDGTDVAGHNGCPEFGYCERVAHQAMKPLEAFRGVTLPPPCRSEQTGHFSTCTDERRFEPANRLPCLKQSHREVEPSLLRAVRGRSGGSAHERALKLRRRGCAR